MKKQMFIMVLVAEAALATNLPAFSENFKCGNQTVRITRVRGWEAQLVAGAPNLANFYWEPLTRKTVFTTNKTGRQTNHIPLPKPTISTISPANALRRNTSTDIKYRLNKENNLTCVALPLVYGQSDIPSAQQLAYEDKQVTPALRKLSVKAKLATSEHCSQATGLVAHAQLLTAVNR